MHLIRDIPRANMNTCETTPRHIWIDQVVGVASVTIEEMETYVTRERINRYYNDGMPVWMAADTVRFFVREGRKHDRADMEIDGLRAYIRTTFTKKKEPHE